MANPLIGYILTCHQVPSDTLQVHADESGIWVETNTLYAGKRTTLSLTRDAVQILILDLQLALDTDAQST